MQDFALMMLAAMALEAAFGWPAWLFARIGHPVTWIGRLITSLDKALNRERDGFATRRAKGVLAMALVVLAAALPALWVQGFLHGFWGVLTGGLLAWPLVAARSLNSHVAAVARPLANGDLPAARRAVAMIVGRDPQVLDQAGVARAALESLAENASDGVVAPLFWGAIFGLPGIAAYKAVNTLDSMIGHRSARFLAFGWASARLDDLINLIPARLTGLLFALTSPRPKAALACMRADARHHRSPNAGWPEAAMAGGLGVRVSGPRLYGDRLAQEPFVNAACPDPGPEDLWVGLALFRRGMLCCAGLLLLVALF
jgi:adenosylcobinamide-phosphate synthase